MNCPKCGANLAPDKAKCPQCGAESVAFQDVESTLTGGAAPVPSKPLPAVEPTGERPVLGVVVIYAETADDTSQGEEPWMGRAYPLRQGEVFFLGKPPAPSEVPRSDGKGVRPAACHIFPFTQEFAHISRRHLCIEMEPGKETLLTDLSTNGIFLVRTGEYLRRPREQAVRVTKLGSDERIVLGVDLGESADPALRERATHYQLRVIRLDGSKEPSPKADSRGGRP